MKKMVLGFSLALTSLGFFLSPALAETGPPVLSSADQAFLASLALPVEPVAPTPAAKRPAFGAKALCTATASCGDGTTVYCEGNNSTTSCSAADRNCDAGEQGHVTCDGATTWCPTSCPPPPCPPDYCATARQTCLNDCYPCGISFTCSSSTCIDTCRCRWSTCPQ